MFPAATRKQAIVNWRCTSSACATHQRRSAADTPDTPGHSAAHIGSKALHSSSAFTHKAAHAVRLGQLAPSSRLLHHENILRALLFVEQGGRCGVSLTRLVVGAECVGRHLPGQQVSGLVTTPYGATRDRLGRSRNLCRSYNTQTSIECVHTSSAIHLHALFTKQAMPTLSHSQIAIPLPGRSRPFPRDPRAHPTAIGSPPAGRTAALASCQSENTVPPPVSLASTTRPSPSRACTVGRRRDKI